MNQRNQDRVPASGRISLAFGHRVTSEFLYNLSSLGCMVERREAAVALGSRVEVGFTETLRETGRVVWVSREALGICFDRPIDDATIDYFRLTDWGAAILPDPGADAQGISTVSRATGSLAG